MRVTDLSSSERHGLARIAARIVWEDREAKDATLWLEFPAALAGAVEPSPNVFLPSAVTCAMSHGERRVLIDGAPCPRHIEGLGTVAAILASWFPRLTAPRIETTHGTAAAASGDRSAICLSGGVDSFAALQENRLSLPPEHPASIRDGILYFGLNTFDFEGDVPRPERLAAFDAQRVRLESFGERAGVTVIPVRTNVRTLYSSWEEWLDVGLAAALVAGAHALPSRIGALTIASHGIGISLLKFGSHPLLDPHFSTFGLDVRSVHAMLPRSEKVRRIAEWPAALAVLRVCFMFDVPEDGFPNCGRCEKCVRTMIELLLCGALDRASSFPQNDVSSEMILAITVKTETRVFYEEYRAALASLGRHDLARAIEDRLAAHSRARTDSGRNGWRRWLGRS